MSFLDFFKGKKKNTDRAALVINDKFLEVMQLEKKGPAVSLMGFNRVELSAGVVENGVIVSESAFQKALLELAQQAKPQPLLTQRLTVSVPFGQLFSFVKKGTRRNDQGADQRLLMEEIRKTSPLAPEDMNLQFYSDLEGHQWTFSAIGWPKSWESSVREALNEIGVESIEFIPEPLAQWAVAESPSAGNFALCSWQDEKCFLSFFYHNLLYDSFLLEFRSKVLLEEAAAYKEAWGTPVQMVYFINTQETAKPLIDSIAKESGIAHLYLDEHKTSLASQLNIQKYSSTLMGLALLLLKE